MVGGQEHRVLAELKGFQARGHVMALCASGHVEVVERAQRSGVQVKEMDFSRLRSPFAAVAAARWLWQEKEQVLNTRSSRDGWVMGISGRGESCSLTQPFYGIDELRGKFNFRQAYYLSSQSAVVFWAAPRRCLRYLNHAAIAAENGQRRNSPRRQRRPFPSMGWLGKTAINDFRLA